ncbi:hypothetical protein AB0M95_03445 [Sphaerisporangium sp. NPDC051017]|uniref:hypothetical protein n=1 Tax=Sphaerisporangium sp. NPDC051017 TaxID=3154636 RepID=UPI00343956AD
MSSVDWTAVANRISFVPIRFGRPSVDRRTAREILGCDDGDLAELAEAGLPYADDGADRLFDPDDLYNLAIYSGTGRTLPERAFGTLFRFTAGGTGGLTVPRAWRLTLRLECGDCRGPAAWSLHEPTGGSFGGGRSRALLPAPSEREAAYTASVVTRGTRTPLVSPLLRKIAYEYLEGGLRWQMLPEDLQVDYDAVHDLGATGCVAGSLYLADRFRIEGYEAEARRGWFCDAPAGIAEVPYAWVEVIDDDGRPKAVDVTTPQLAARFSPGAQVFQDLCVGSAFNRVVLCDGLADEPLAAHACGGDPARVVVRSDIRAAHAGTGGTENV